MLKQSKINASTLATLLLSASLILPIAEIATSQSIYPGSNAVRSSGLRVVEPKVEFTQEQNLELEKAKISGNKLKEEEEKRTKPVGACHFCDKYKYSSNFSWLTN